MALERVQNVYTSTETDISSTYTMAIGPEIKYFQMPAYNDTNFVNSTISHTWSLLNYRTESDYNSNNISLAEGGVLKSALAELPGAFWNTGGVLFSIPKENYRVNVYGQNIALQIPLNSAYTGMTSGLTATTLYSSFVYTPNTLQKYTGSICAGVEADIYKSEPNPTVTNDIGIGYKYVIGTNPNETPNSNYKFYDSGVVFLVTDSVYNTFSGTTGSSVSWNYLYDNKNRYANGARLITFEPSISSPWWAGVGGYDKIVGAFFTNYGVGIIFDPNLVQGFDWSTVNGDPTSLTGGTFTSGQTAFNAADEDLSENINIQLMADPNKWVSSSNSSYIGLGSDDCGVAITSVTLHDELGRCLGIVKPNGAWLKPVGKYLMADLTIPVSEPVQTSLAVTVGLIWNGVSPL